MDKDGYHAPCTVCRAVTWWALLTRIGRQSTWRCTGCGKLRTWLSR